MKRFSAREFAFLTVPVVLIAGVGWWASRRGAPDVNGIAVVTARKFALTPALVAKGASVAARVELEPNSPGFLRTSQKIDWNADFRVRAGERVVWSDSGNNPKARIMVWGLEAPNTNYVYEAAFDLNKVPAEWGEVVLEWDAELKQSGRDFGRNWKQKSGRAGKIVLRGAGEILPKPVVSTDPHLKLVSSLIELTPPSTGAVFYQVTLQFEPDGAVTQDEIGHVSSDFTLSDPKTKTISKMYGAMANWTSVSVNPRRPVCEVRYNVSSAKGRPNSRLNWELGGRNYWPLTGTLPVTDARGKVLLGERSYP